MIRRIGGSSFSFCLRFLFDALLMRWIELLAARNRQMPQLNSVNPLKLVNCDELNFQDQNVNLYDANLIRFADSNFVMFFIWHEHS